MKHARQKATILYCSGFQSHRMHRELVHCAKERGWIIVSIPWSAAETTFISTQSIDGVISHLPARFTKMLVQTLDSVPHVTLNAQTTSELKIPGVVLNHFAAGEMVARHYIELGFTHFAAFCHLEVDHTFTERLSGFSEAIQAAGFLAPQSVKLPLSARYSYLKSLSLFGNALKSMSTPLASMAANDRVAVKLMHACWQNDLSIPAQVAVCGFDNDPIACDLAPVPLSSVDTDPERQAQEAVRIMEDILGGKPAPSEPIVIEPKSLDVRRSSGVQASKDLTVAKALAYIHEHAWAADLSIPELADRAGVSKTTLFVAFRRELSQTPLQYITDLRIAKAQRLLKESDQKIKDIRPQCGFASDYQMYQAFKKTTGRSPRSFR